MQRLISILALVFTTQLFAQDSGCLPWNSLVPSGEHQFHLEPGETKRVCIILSKYVAFQVQASLQTDPVTMKLGGFLKNRNFDMKLRDVTHSIEANYYSNKMSEIRNRYFLNDAIMEI